MYEHNEITVIILSGGNSSRMMEEKGLVSFRKKTLIGHVIDSVKKITGNILIITGNTAYRQFGYPCYEDIKFIDEVNPGLLSSTFHFPENMLNNITSSISDSEAMCPEYKVVACTIRKSKGKYKN